MLRKCGVLSTPGEGGAREMERERNMEREYFIKLNIYSSRLLRFYKQSEKPKDPVSRKCSKVMANLFPTDCYNDKKKVNRSTLFLVRAFAVAKIKIETQNCWNECFRLDFS